MSGFRPLKVLFGPFYMHLFFAYLVCAVLFAIVVFVKTIWGFHPFFKRRQLSPSSVNALQPDVLASIGLANPRSLEALVKMNSNRNNTAVSQEAVSPVLKTANYKFLYVLDLVRANAQTLDRLMVLTLLLSSLITVAGAFPTFAAEFNDTRATALDALIPTVFSLLDRLGIGIAVSTFFYGISSFMHRLVANRKVRWTYFIHWAGGNSDGDV